MSDLDRRVRAASVDTYPWDGTEPDTVIARRAAFRAGAEYALTQAASDIDDERAAIKRQHGDDPEDMYVRGRLYGLSVAATAARSGVQP